MAIAIANNTPRVNYTVAQGASQTTFAVPFDFFDDDEVKIYVDGTLKTITTHYSISGGNGTTGTITMGSAVVGATGGSSVAVVRDVPIERTSDFSAGAAISRPALNEQLDVLTALASDLNDRVGRTLQLNDFEPAASLELPALAARKGRVIGFNSSNGNLEAGPTIADVQSLAAITADIGTLADIEDGTDATDAIQSVAAIASNISTILSISSAITTVSGISSQVTSVAADATDIGAVAAKATEIGRLGTADAVSDLNTLGTADAVSDMNTLAAISTDISSVGAKSSLITSTLATNLTTVGPQIATLQSLASVFSGTQSLTVTVASGNLYGGGGTGNVFYINGSSNPPLTLVRGITYTFDVSDSSVSGHPLAFKDSGGNAFTTGVTTNGTAGSAGATVVIAVPSTGTMPASYYCTSHGAGMGNTIATQTNDIATVATNIADINTVASNIGTIAQKATVDEATALAIALGG